MKINELTSLELIELSLKAKTKDQVIRELAEILHRNQRISDLDKFVEDIYERETLGSTGIGFKIAIPHTKSKYVTKPSLVFGKSKNGIDYESLDGLPSELFFLIAMPAEKSNTHLQALAILSRNLIHEDFREQLLKANTKEKVLEIINSIDEA